MKEVRELCLPTILKSLIKRDGLRLDDLAAKIGVTKQAISTYTTGKATPSYSTLIKIASYFNVSTDYLLTGQNPENKILVKGKLALPDTVLDTLLSIYADKDMAEFLPCIEKLLSNPEFYYAVRGAVRELVCVVHDVLRELESKEEGITKSDYDTMHRKIANAFGVAEYGYINSFFFKQFLPEETKIGKVTDILDRRKTWP